MLKIVGNKLLILVGLLDKIKQIDLILWQPRVAHSFALSSAGTSLSTEATTQILMVITSEHSKKPTQISSKIYSQKPIYS